MKIINLDSKFELTQAQISFAESVIVNSEIDSRFGPDSISALMNEIPIFLLSSDKMPVFKPVCGDMENPATEILGFYQHKSEILGVKRPVIGLCPERFLSYVKNEKDLTILIAKVIIHEFAHALMRLHPGAVYEPVDEFYEWMEEPMANLITLEYFQNYMRFMEHPRNHKRTEPLGSERPYAPEYVFDYVKKFIQLQPSNYRLGLDLFEHRVNQWWFWRMSKSDIQNKTAEKEAWIDYVKTHVGTVTSHTEKDVLQKLFDDLWKNS